MKSEFGQGVEQDIAFWIEKEKNLKANFRTDIVNERHFLKEKHRFFSSAINKYGTNISESDKIILNIVKGELDKLERHLYPNMLMRLIAKLTREIKPRVVKSLVPINKGDQSPPLTFRQKNNQQVHKEEVNKLSQESKTNLKVTHDQVLHAQRHPIENNAHLIRNAITTGSVRSDDNSQLKNGIQKHHGLKNTKRHRHNLR